MENKEQQYKNLTLITINNTLHIKADNLEPVQVDSSCVQEIHEKAFKNYDDGTHQYNHKFWYHLKEGINISELSDRIEVREIRISGATSESFCVVKHAFLLPEKEDKELLEDLDKSIIEPYAQFKCNKRTYTIEEIEKALNKTNICHYDKLEVLNNLKN